MNLTDANARDESRNPLQVQYLVKLLDGQIGNLMRFFNKRNIDAKHIIVARTSQGENDTLI